jgi:hypothetical protein
MFSFFFDPGEAPDQKQDVRKRVFEAAATSSILKLKSSPLTVERPGGGRELSSLRAKEMTSPALRVESTDVELASLKIVRRNVNFEDDLKHNKDSGYNKVRQLLDLDDPRSESKRRYWLYKNAVQKDPSRIITDVLLNEEEDGSEDTTPVSVLDDFSKEERQVEQFIEKVRTREHLDRNGHLRGSLRDVLRVFHDACVAVGVDSHQSFEIVWKTVILARVKNVGLEEDGSLKVLKEMLSKTYLRKLH